MRQASNRDGVSELPLHASATSDYLAGLFARSRISFAPPRTMTADDWNEMLGRMSPAIAARMRRLESHTYQATRDDMSENQRIEVARYVVLLGMTQDLIAKHWAEYLQRFANEGWHGVARGLYLRSSVSEAAASSFEKRWVPDDAVNAHHRLISSLRDMAAIDRRAAIEVRARESLEYYSEGSEESSRAFRIANEAVIEIVSVLKNSFEDGELRRLIVRTTRSHVTQ